MVARRSSLPPERRARRNDIFDAGEVFGNRRGSRPPVHGGPACGTRDVGRVRCLGFIRAFTSARTVRSVRCVRRCAHERQPRRSVARSSRTGAGPELCISSGCAACEFAQRSDLSHSRTSRKPVIGVVAARLRVWFQGRIHEKSSSHVAHRRGVDGDARRRTGTRVSGVTQRDGN